MSVQCRKAVKQFTDVLLAWSLLGCPIIAHGWGHGGLLSCVTLKAAMARTLDSDTEHPVLLLSPPHHGRLYQSRV